MQSSFMYILLSDNCFTLSCCFLLRIASCLALFVLFLIASSCFFLLLNCSALFLPSPFSDNHTTGRSIPVSKFTGLTGFSDHTVIDTEKIIRSSPTGIRPPHHARTDEFNYSSMESFLVQVKILSLVDSAGWW